MEKKDFHLPYTKETIEKALRKVGIKKGDILLVHSDSTPVFKLYDPNSLVNPLDLLKRCFLDILGPTGTLVVPTFNYDFCKGKPYSHKKSMSQVGMFTNYILRDNASHRSFHPIFSFAAIGSDAKNICNNVSKSSLGRGSVFHKLHKINTKIVFFNLDIESCTFVHYVEESLSVNYRFLKNFKGKVKKENIEWEDSFEFYVRYLDREVIPYFARLGDYLESKNKMNKVFLFDKYPISLVKADDIYQAIKKNIVKNPYYLLKHPPKKSEE